MTKKCCIAILGALCVVLLACDEKAIKPTSAPPPLAEDNPLIIHTTFYPTSYFATRIAGRRGTVVCPVPSDADPIFWQPTREQIAAYQDADVIIINGAGFEKWISTASLPETRIVDSSSSLPEPFIRFETVTHNHGAGGAHSHAGVDGHTWMDPVNAIAQATEISSALSRLRPRDSKDFAAGYAGLLKDLQLLDRQFAELSAPAAKALVMASHPAYNYPSRRYSLGVVNVAMDPERDANPEELAAVEAAVSRRPEVKTRVMLWESRPTPGTAAALQERFGIASIVCSPCEALDPADAAAGENYLSVMQNNIAVLKGALAPAR
ncbi:MAG: zinc ABC transporter substrate-binding protein [Pyrinomonadaceae bacterium]|nr:zinc ABC transporter substrate-binding protein [Phycisphaerales bacterium]